MYGAYIYADDRTIYCSYKSTIQSKSIKIFPIMRNSLPRFAFLTGEGLVGIKVICLEAPYLIASIYDINRHDEEKVDDFIENMAQGRVPMAKIPGYTIFLKVLTTMENCPDRAYQQSILNEMVHYVLENRIQKKPGLYRMSEQSGKSEKKFDPEVQKQKRMRERKKKPTESND